MTPSLPGEKPAELAGAVGSHVYSAAAGTLAIAQQVGAGSFGAVFRAHSLAAPRRSFAVKRLLIQPPSHGAAAAAKTPHAHAPPAHVPNHHHGNPAAKTDFLRMSHDAIAAETRIMRRLGDIPAVVRLIDTIYYYPPPSIAAATTSVATAPTHVDLVMDFCESDLLSILSSQPHAGGVGDPLLAREIIIQLIDAVRACHNRGVFHRDLKPENILLSQSDLCLKLCDFGLATTKRFSSEFGCGTARYMSPECARPIMAEPVPSVGPARPHYAPSNDFDAHVRRDSGYNDPEPLPYDCALDDTWAVGILILNILTSKNPWGVADASTDANYQAYLYGHPDALANSFGLTQDTARLICGLLHPDPNQRWNLAQAKHAFKSIRQYTKSMPPIPDYIFQTTATTPVSAQPLLTPVSPVPPQRAPFAADYASRKPDTRVATTTNEFCIDNIIDHYTSPSHAQDHAALIHVRRPYYPSTPPDDEAHMSIFADRH